ncbi:MAG: hypothetical protein NXI31_09095 [bacterium]|nr:hypothetical protein [bacterium]
MTFVGPSTATYGLAIPNSEGLAGLTMFVQGWAAAPGANAANAIVSNGVQWGIGHD